VKTCEIKLILNQGDLHCFVLLLYIFHIPSEVIQAFNF
jgi:hypothetical protein